MATDTELVVGEFDAARFPSGAPNLDEAWLGIYQMLIWYEHGRLHIKEANDLKKNKRWQERADLAERYIAGRLGVKPSELPGLVDRMMNLPRWADITQRNNPLGNGLRMLVAEALRRWADGRFRYLEEEKATNWFPGIHMPGRSEEPKIDVLAANAVPRAVISCKWSYRHDRISDVTNECQEYKAAAARRQFSDFGYYLVTNEFDARRLEKVINQPCVDALVHVHLPLALEVTGGTPELRHAMDTGRLLDLGEFARLTKSW